MSQSMLAIKTKLGSSSNSLRDYSAARGLTEPDSMLEFDTWLGGGGGAGGCECYRVTNEGGRNDGGITFTYNRCSDGNLSSLLVGPGSSRTVCVRSGTSIDSDSGLMTAVPCLDPCTTNDDCEDCI